MAFPGTYNFNYYRGDTSEFKIYPKTSSGAIFDLTQFDKTSGVKFTISTERGSAGYDSQIAGTAFISEDSTFITCRIDPEDGTLLSPQFPYEYDVEISRVDTSGDSPITYTYTLVTGRISVTEQITGALPQDNQVGG